MEETDPWESEGELVVAEDDFTPSGVTKGGHLEPSVRRSPVVKLVVDSDVITDEEEEEIGYRVPPIRLRDDTNNWHVVVVNNAQPDQALLLAPKTPGSSGRIDKSRSLLRQTSPSLNVREPSPAAAEAFRSPVSVFEEGDRPGKGSAARNDSCRGFYVPCEKPKSINKETTASRQERSRVSSQRSQPKFTFRIIIEAAQQRPFVRTRTLSDDGDIKSLSESSAGKVGKPPFSAVRQWLTIQSKNKPALTEIRSVHNDMERQRRVELRTEFERLKELLPGGRSQDSRILSKLTILNSAREFCEKLQARRARLLQQRKLLRDRNEVLCRRMAELVSQNPSDN